MARRIASTWVREEAKKEKPGDVRVRISRHWSSLDFTAIATSSRPEAYLNLASHVENQMPMTHGRSTPNDRLWRKAGIRNLRQIGPRLQLGYCFWNPL